MPPSNEAQIKALLPVRRSPSCRAVSCPGDGALHYFGSGGGFGTVTRVGGCDFLNWSPGPSALGQRIVQSDPLTVAGAASWLTSIAMTTAKGFGVVTRMFRGLSRTASQTVRLGPPSLASTMAWKPVRPA
jgi:hypothetical protein